MHCSGLPRTQSSANSCIRKLAAFALACACSWAELHLITRALKGHIWHSQRLQISPPTCVFPPVNWFV